MRKLIMFLAAGIVGIGLQAKTLTWVGVNQKGDISAASNWQDEGGQASAPSPGDTLQFNSTVTNLTGSFSVGTVGLTVSKTAKVTSRVVFTGSGDITLNGSGEFAHGSASTAFTGSWRVYGCALSTFNSTQDCLGKGQIHLYAASGNQPQLVTSFGYLSNDIYVHDAITHATNCLRSNNPSTWSGTIYADADFSIYCGWSGAGNFFKIGNISAPGHTVTITAWNADEKHAIKLTGSVDANLVVKGSGTQLYLSGRNPATSSTVSVEAGKVAFQGTAYWESTSLLVKKGAGVRLAGTVLLSDETAVELEDETATLEMASTLVHIGSLKVGETTYPSGKYRATSAMPMLTGDGLLDVGQGAAFWIGGPVGAWSSGDNWSSGTAPKNGGVAVFTNSVRLLDESFDFGEGGVTLVNETVVITQRTMFAGSGSYSKFGKGTVRPETESSYTGGTILGDGIIDVHVQYTNRIFGASGGTVRMLRNTDGTYARILAGFWDIKMPYHFVIEGALTGTYPRFQIGNCLDITDAGSLTSDSDFIIYHAWGEARLNCPVSAPGHTVKFTGNLNMSGGKDAGYTSYLAKSVNASIDKQGTHRLRLDGVSPGVDNRLTVNGGTLTLNTGAAWGGTNVTVAADAILTLKGNGNLSKEATLTVAANGKVNVAANVTVHVGSLVVGGVVKGPGRYSKTNLGDYITGDGKIKVGNSGMVVVFR